MQKKVFCICFILFCIVVTYCGYSLDIENEKEYINEDEQLDYKKLAAQENAQMENLLRENYEAVKQPENTKEQEEPKEEQTKASYVKAVEIDIDNL